jgi:hypothetical protein
MWTISPSDSSNLKGKYHQIFIYQFLRCHLQKWDPDLESSTILLIFRIRDDFQKENEAAVYDTAEASPEVPLQQGCRRRRWLGISSVIDNARAFRYNKASALSQTPQKLKIFPKNQHCLRHHWWCISDVWDTTGVVSSQRAPVNIIIQRWFKPKF